MKKILIKTNLEQLNGLSYHRLIVPYSKVSDLKDFQCDVYAEPEKLSDEFLSTFSAIIYQREMLTDGKSPELIKRYKDLGLKVIFDIDDYWHLPPTHHLYNLYKQVGIPQQTEEILKLVDLVTTTTKHLASVIQKFNPNVEVLPNCLDTNEKQWQSNKIESDKIRFGYIAGVHHLQDIKILEKPIIKAVREDLNAKFVLAGYTENSHYKEYERVMSARGWAKEQYLRINALPVNQYGFAYNQTDVSLIPLVSNNFSAMKSEIKMLEAAAHGNAVMVSNVAPYNIFPRNTAKFIGAGDTGEWYKGMKRMINEPDYRKDLALELECYVKLNYDLNKWTAVRKQILQSVLA